MITTLMIIIITFESLIINRNDCKRKETENYTQPVVMIIYWIIYQI